MLGNDKRSLLERQTHRVIFGSRVKQVRSAAEWPKWVWMWLWLKLNFTQSTHPLTHPLSCHADTRDPSAHWSWLYWAEQDGAQTLCSCWEGSLMFVRYRMKNTEMVCFRKQHYCMIVSWNEPAWKNCLTAVMLEWDLSLHSSIYSLPTLPYMCCKRQLNSVLKT